jgi:L-threonylcarbamoyladenylate synthase
VLSLTGEVPVVLRPGGVTAEMLIEALGEVRVHPSALSPLKAGEAAPSPGMKYRHYAPNAKVRVVTGENGRTARALCDLYDAARNDGENPVILAAAEDAARFAGRNVLIWGGRDRPEELAGRLFSELREADARGHTLILCSGVEAVGIGLAVMNRLIRAAGFEVTEV